MERKEGGLPQIFSNKGGVYIKHDDAWNRIRWWVKIDNSNVTYVSNSQLIVDWRIEFSKGIGKPKVCQLQWVLLLLVVNWGCPMLLLHTVLVFVYRDLKVGRILQKSLFFTWSRKNKFIPTVFRQKLGRLLARLLAGQK